MATEVLTGFNDFVLFPQQRNDIYPSFQLPFADGSVDQPYQDMGSNFPQGFTSFGNYYEPYHQEHVHHNAPRSQADEHAYSKNVASASPSISLSQFLDQAPSNFSHTSVASGQSTASSAVGSPYSQHQSLPAGQDQWNEMGLGIAGTLAPTDMFPGTYQLTSTEAERVFDDKFASTFVDPTLLCSLDRPALNAPASPYPAYMPASYSTPSHTVQPPSPAPSDVSSHGSHRNSLVSRTRHPSPYLYNPYPTPTQSRMGRRGSISSSRFSVDSPRSVSLGFEEDGKERERCPHPECGRPFKDLKAHMLTHQAERPEKCPIVTCEYHTKGFARKYDRCRHTLTHYKGTMVCDFCPNSGSAAEKSFNRADVFKRHLTSVHGVEQSPPNSRKKAPSGAKKAGNIEAKVGKCSTCSSTFSNAQEFYDHLDECVLKFLDQGEPSERVNEQRLKEINEDPDVKETLERHMLPTELEMTTRANLEAEEGDEDDEGEGEEEEVDAAWIGNAAASSRSGKGSIAARKEDSS